MPPAGRATTLPRMDAIADTPATELQPTLARLRAAWQAGKPGLAQRRADLQRLRAVFAHQVETMDVAIRADFGHRSTHENLISEAMIVLSEIDHALRHLRALGAAPACGGGLEILAGARAGAAAAGRRGRHHRRRGTTR